MKFRLIPFVLPGLLVAALAWPLHGQGTGAPSSVALVPAHESLLPPSFGGWKTSTGPAAGDASSSMSLLNANKRALEEDNPERSQVATYAGPDGRQMHVEAIQFADYTGAWSAYTMLRTPGLKDAKALGTVDAVGDNAVLFVSGATLVVAYPATAADLRMLQPLAGSLPVVHGSAAQGPVLPEFLPGKSLAPGSVRYALGPATYAVEGGALPANSVGWDHSAEALTARYTDKRGDERLTLFIYPTPPIAKGHLASAQALLPGMGAGFANAQARRDMELVMVADGTFSAADTKQLLSSIHMRQIASVDKDMGLTEHEQVSQAATMLGNIALLSGFLCGAAVLLGLFFGGGRALLRVMRGKSAYVEIEFLSLHLANQNAPPIFTGEGARQVIPRTRPNA